MSDAWNAIVEMIEGRSNLQNVQTAELDVCEACESGGWECYSIGHMDPHFRECPVCHNPEGLPRP